MKNDPLLHAEMLLQKFREFMEAGPGDSGELLKNFGFWLQHGNLPRAGGLHEHMDNPERAVGMYIVLLHNVTRNRLNKLMNDTPFVSIMDYQFLVFLASHGKQRKTDLISRNFMEMPSGIEVIRRLLKNGWIYEEENPEDRRSKYVDISPEGKKIAAETGGRIDSVYDSFCVGLSPREKREILFSLELLLSTLPAGGVNEYY